MNIDEFKSRVAELLLSDERLREIAARCVLDCYDSLLVSADEADYIDEIIPPDSDDN